MTAANAGQPQEQPTQPPQEDSVFRCAASSRRRGDPLAGTAAPASRWLLIEHPGPWDETTMRSRPLDSPVGESISAAAVVAGARVLLIRRPARPAPRPETAWVVVDREQGATWGRWEVVDDLVEARERLVGDIERRGEQRPLFLVCVHGRRDVCCAVRGRPVAQALAARWPGQTWECSHLGGDRFAPNVLVVPDGTTYGRLDERQAVRVVDAHVRGEVDTRYLRGSSADPPVTQAAVVGALRRWDPAGPGDIRASSVRTFSTDEWLVELAGTASLPDVMRARVTRRPRPPELLTCRAAAASSADEYAVQWLPVVPDPTPGH